jgi:hypothetical protein
VERFADRVLWPLLHLIAARQWLGADSEDLTFAIIAFHKSSVRRWSLDNQGGRAWEKQRDFLIGRLDFVRPLKLLFGMAVVRVSKRAHCLRLAALASFPVQ